MNIKRLPIAFQNVIGLKATCQQDSWYEYAQSIRNNVVLNNLYATGPISFQVEESSHQSEDMTFTFFQPVNDRVKVKSNDEFFFKEELFFEDGLLIRHADLNDDIEEIYMILEMAAKELGVQLQKPYLHIYLNVYGEGIIDIYAPIVGMNDND